MKCRLIPSCIILIPFLILVTGCSESPSIFKDQELTLDVDAEVTETWITLSSNPLKRKATYIVQRDTTIIFEGRLHSADTLIHDTGLEPATTYSYTAWARKGGDSSERMTVTTMDTTKRNFEVSSFVFDGVFNDCLIWDEDSFWVTGDYTKRDSAGNLIGPFTILSYDNGLWEDIEVKHEAGWSEPVPLTNVGGIWAANKKDVWLTGYNIYRWRGGVATLLWEGNSEYIDDIFGFDKNEIYVGGNGILLKVAGSVVNEVQIPQNYNVRDIWGNEERELIVSITDPIADNHKLIFLNDLKIEKIEVLKFSDFVVSHWFKSSSKVFIGGKNAHILNRNQSITSFELKDIFAISKIRGTDINNVFAVTFDGKIFHFNGASWKKIYETSTSLRGLSVAENLVITVGHEFLNARIVQIVNNSR